MEELFPFVMVCIAIFGSIASSARKAKERKAAEEKRRAASPVKPKPAAKPSHPYKPAQPTIMPPMAFSDIPGQVIAPTVHTHIQPDCDTHDVPGSLGVTSTEGKDPCHEDQLTFEHTFAETPQPEGGLTFDWSGENMVKAFVMQEVLSRPANRVPACQRQAR